MSYCQNRYLRFILLLLLVNKDQSEDTTDCAIQSIFRILNLFDSFGLFVSDFMSKWPQSL